MKIKFYGTRGSIPVPEREFMEFGGNTTCVRVTTSDGQIIIFDAGTGIRQLGKDLIAASQVPNLHLRKRVSRPSQAGTG